MLPDREGRFKATVLDCGVAETGPNLLTTFTCQLRLTQELVGDEWMPIREDFGIVGYFYIEKRDHTLNSITIDNLKAAFGWDGRDVFWLQDADFSRHVVQIKLGFETYDGKTRIKVQYIDAEDAVPMSIPRADDSMRRSISARLGPKLRAAVGGSPAPAPVPTGVPTEKTGITMAQAWEAFAKLCPRDDSRENLEKKWFGCLETMYPGKLPSQLGDEDWEAFITQATEASIPF